VIPNKLRLNTLVLVDFRSRHNVRWWIVDAFGRMVGGACGRCNPGKTIPTEPTLRTNGSTYGHREIPDPQQNCFLIGPKGSAAEEDWKANLCSCFGNLTAKSRAVVLADKLVRSQYAKHVGMALNSWYLQHTFV